MAEWEIISTPNAKTPQNEQNAPWEIIPTQPDPSAGWEVIRTPEGQPVRSEGMPTQKKPFRPEQILDWVMQPIDPTLKTDLFGQPPKDTVDPTQPFHPGQMIGRIGDEARGMAYDLGTGVVDALTTPFTYLSTPMIGSPVRRVAPPPPPVILTPLELDMSLAEKATATGYPPEPPFVPSVRRLTGETVFAPSLDLGMHPRGGLTSRRNALGEKIRLPNQMRPGEYPVIAEGQLPLDMQIERGVLGEPATPQTSFADYARTQVGEKTNLIPEGSQGSLLGGPFREGQGNIPTGPHLYQPGEQTEMGLIPLRPQRLFIPRHARDLNAPLELEMARVLRTRVLSKTEEETLLTEPAVRGGSPVDVTFGPLKQTASAGYRAEERFVLPKEFTVENTVDGAVFPSFWTRVTGSGSQVMRKAGPIGERLAALFDAAYENRATGLSGDYSQAERALDQVLGPREKGSRLQVMGQQLSGGENAFIAGMRKRWNLTEAEQESLFNHMDSHGVEPPMNDRVRQTAQILFEQGTYPASSDPGVRMLSVKNPFTGKDIPLGEPNMFMPHQPISAIAHETLSEAQWGLLYARKGGEALGVSLNTFKKTIIALSRHDPEVTAAKMKGLENMQLLDLGSLGGSRYQWAKKLGYETDPFRAAFRFNSMARLRGQLEQIKEPVNALLLQIPPDQTNASEWLHLAAERAMLNPGKYDATTRTTNILKGVSHVLDMTMLQLGGVANLSQVIYPITRGGLKASLQGFGAMLTGADRQLIQDSGALFPAILNELTHPTGPMAVVSSGAFRLYGLSLGDRFTRNFAANVGNKFIAGVEANYLAAPTTERLGKLLAELGGDPKRILEAGKIPDDMRLAMIQRFANHTAGVTDLRGVPLWATSENPWARLVNKFRTFSAANTAEIGRLAQNSPDYATFTKRMGTLLAGGYVVGAGMNEFRYSIQSALMGQEAPKHKRDWVYHAQNLLMGLGSLQGMFIAAAMESPARAITNVIGGPVAGVATGLLQDLTWTIQHGVGWRSAKTLSQRAPLVGPVLGAAVRKEVSRESRLLQEEQRALSGE